MTELKTMSPKSSNSETKKSKLSKLLICESAALKVLRLVIIMSSVNRIGNSSI